MEKYMARKKEQNTLLLKDLCARLPYGVKCNVGNHNPYTLSRIEVDSINGHLLDFIEMGDGLDMQIYLSEVKPYLFPLSCMTDEQRCEYHNHCDVGLTKSGCKLYYDCAESLDWLNAHHFDYRELIPKGLAIDCANLNIY